jgi:protein-tyrosine-phosphatase
MIPRVLFVCVENSCRSQMAEAFAHRLAGEHIEALSAGSKPSGTVNPKAIAAMAELGYDLTTHASRALDEVALGNFDAVVTMGCGDACPHVPARLRLDWDLPDPKHMQPTEFAAVRDDIEHRVRALLTRLHVATG